MTTNDESFVPNQVAGSETLLRVSRDIYPVTKIKAYLKEFKIPAEHYTYFVFFLQSSGSIYLDMKSEIPLPSTKSRRKRFKSIANQAKKLEASINALNQDYSALQFFWYWLGAINHPQRPDRNLMGIPMWDLAKRVQLKNGKWQHFPVTQENVLEAIKYVAFCAKYGLRLKSLDKGGKPRDHALYYFMKSAHDFWCIKLKRSFSREIDAKGEPISPGLHFCLTILKPLVPDINVGQVRSMMRVAVSEHRKEIGKNPTQSKA